MFHYEGPIAQLLSFCAIRLPIEAVIFSIRMCPDDHY